MEFISILVRLSFPVFAYLLGSIPWGIVLTRLFSATDIRTQGSGNIGATNVMRVAGTTLGVLTFVGDFLKGALPVYLAVALTGSHNCWDEIYRSLVGLAAFLGHLYPVFMRFKDGGKGVATAAGVFMLLSPVACIVTILVFILFICWCNRVSAGSLAAAAVLPVAVWEASQSAVITGCAVVVGILIFLRHHDNIRRIIAGTEPPIWRD
jgi:glycerol-3-phosphate acyltransferase PlsY